MRTGRDAIFKRFEQSADHARVAIVGSFLAAAQSTGGRRPDRRVQKYPIDVGSKNGDIMLDQVLCIVYRSAVFVAMSK
jgi:hypothetical protein